MQIIKDGTTLRSAITQQKVVGKRIAFVPTMGNLHQGHLDLVREAKKVADSIVVSIYVNPTQFGANEDLDKYPRTLAADCAQLEALGVDFVFTPSDAEMYPNGFENRTQISVEHLSNVLCGSRREGHFNGVCIIVAKLFNLVQPDYAIFGQKDLQQLTIIRHMTSDLCMPITIIGVDTRREQSGLAMSSRNGYLSDQQKLLAANIYATLKQIKQAIERSHYNYSELSSKASAALNELGFRTDYLEIRRTSDLQLAEDGQRDAELAIFIAAYLDNTRLIDNMIIRL